LLVWDTLQIAIQRVLAWLPCTCVLCISTESLHYS
jgi:hypothetical protein